MPLSKRSFAVLIGLGADPEVRESHADAGQALGTLQLAVAGSHRTWTIADLAAHEADDNPIHDPDSNPSSVIRVGSKFVVTDAGGNTLVTASWTGSTRTTAVFQDQLADRPAVPGSAARHQDPGPGGARPPSSRAPTAPSTSAS